MQEDLHGPEPEEVTVTQIVVRYETERCVTYRNRSGWAVLQTVVTESGEAVLFIRKSMAHWEQVDLTPELRGALIALGKELEGANSDSPL
jgi:hypothetical protein